MIRRLLERLAAPLATPAPIGYSTMDSCESGGKYTSENSRPASPEVKPENHVDDDRPQPEATPAEQLMPPRLMLPRTIDEDELAAAIAEHQAHPMMIVPVPPTDGEIVAAWLAKVRGDYQPWARRHAHQLIDELIERARNEARS